jgi:HPt (histidine-containing phosphotransfer) domain-containing protein
VDIAVLRGIVGDDDDAVREVLQSFQRSTTESLHRLDAAIATADAEEIGGVAHRVLAGARTVGAATLAATCEQVESAEDADRPGLAPTLREQLTEVMAAIALHIPVAAED